jgi:hypothetical protein
MVAGGFLRARCQVHPQRQVTLDSDTESLAALWPLFGLVIQMPALRLRLPREEDLPALARAVRDIAGLGEPRLQMLTIRMRTAKPIAKCTGSAFHLPAR